MSEANQIVLILFFFVWSAVMGSYFYFAWHVAPSTLSRWAEKHGYQIIGKKNAGPLDWFSYAKGSGHQIYRVSVLDEGKSPARPGRSRIPLLVLPVVEPMPGGSPMGLGDRTIATNRASDRRTVLCFAAADIVLATLVLAMELGLVFTLALVCG